MYVFFDSVSNQITFNVTSPSNSGKWCTCSMTKTGSTFSIHDLPTGFFTPPPWLHLLRPSQHFHHADYTVMAMSLNGTVIMMDWGSVSMATRGTRQCWRCSQLPWSFPLHFLLLPARKWNHFLKTHVANILEVLGIFNSKTGYWHKIYFKNLIKNAH